jgi:hypothetical protein
LFLKTGQHCCSQVKAQNKNKPDTKYAPLIEFEAVLFDFCKETRLSGHTASQNSVQSFCTQQKKIGVVAILLFLEIGQN